MNILVTGAGGYIGSHAALELLNQGHHVIGFDSLERGYQTAIRRIEHLANQQITFIKGDLLNTHDLKQVFSDHPIDAVIHFAAYKDVGEADKSPEKYYRNNVFGTLNLLQAMVDHQVSKIVFSSTSAVYGDSDVIPMHEDLPRKPKNAYGKSKATVEWILEDYYKSYNFSAIALRYFNAAGAHPSGQIGEDPRRCGNLIPLVLQTLIGQREKFLLYGNQFPTPDGTQQRDYIHVMDLATGHAAALKKLDQPGFNVYNLGTGTANSCLQIIKLAEKTSGLKLTYEIAPPRPGDPVTTLSDPTKAQVDFGWKAQYTIEDIISHQWNWVKQNPSGYNE